MSNFLTRLELQGFKSFAPKTVFDLKERVVGIVGPNGSGKSNIIDAIRWVLGERDAKNLRGEVLDNLIFAGTPKKTASGLARVALVFNNSKKIFPVDSEEVELVRRIDRSGTSQFFLNNEEIKMKNLIPLLAKARLGSRGLTIIGQGQADIFVRINPEERRLMIEEIIGLKEFRLKKKIAERRLEKTAINIKTLKAKLEETLPHLRFLRKQKNKKDKRSDIEENLKEVSLQYFSFLYHSIDEKIQKLEHDIQRVIADKKKEEKIVSELERALDKVSETSDREELSGIRSEIQKLSEKRINLTRDLAKAEARSEFTKKEESFYSNSYLLSLIQSFIKDAKEALQKNGEAAQSHLRYWTERFENLFKEGAEEYQESGDKIKNLKKELAEAEKELKGLREKEYKILTAQEEKNAELKIQIKELEKEKDKLREMGDKLQKLSLDKERLQFRMRELENRWHSLGINLGSLKNLPKRDAPKNMDEAERRIDRLRSELIAIGEIDESTIKEAEETERHYEFLKNEMEDLEHAAKDLEKMTKDLDERIHEDFKKYFSLVNKEFNKYFRLMFGGGKARLKLYYYRKPAPVAEGGEEAVEEPVEDKETREQKAGVDIDLNLPKKKITSLDMLSGGEKSLVSLAALFALISVAPPPFLVLDEIDAALDEVNARRFAELINEFSEKSQFIIVTHNRVTMEVINTLYGVTMGEDGVSKVLSLKFEEAEHMASSM